MIGHSNVTAGTTYTGTWVLRNGAVGKRRPYGDDRSSIYSLAMVGIVGLLTIGPVHLLESPNVVAGHVED